MVKSFARTFGQDLMRGEHVVGQQGGRRPANAKVAGGASNYVSPGHGGLSDAMAYSGKRQAAARRKHSASLKDGLTFGTSTDPYREEQKIGRATKAIGTQGWVQDKIAEGDIDGGMAAGQTGTSIFDPVLCELAYRWFSPPDGVVLDPFAGGSVRGVVAAKLGRAYVGVDLRPEQAAANEAQAARICAGEDPTPKWIVGDAAQVLPGLDLAADFVFSCPPYGDLEVYSDDPLDLSTMDREAFLAAYRLIIAASVGKLKADRFACFVVGDYRDASGYYAGFIGETIAAFAAAGARLYNEAILVTAAGSLPIRAGKQFAATRKLGKTHQNVLIFCNGDPRKATEACGEVEIDDEMFALLEAGNDAPAAGDQFGEQL
jgi:DNA methylase